MPWDEMDNWLKNDTLPLDSYRLLEIYETAHSTDVGDLKRAAKELYPARFAEQDPRIFVHKSSWRGFLHDGEYQKAEYTIMGSKLNAIGVMPDGTAYIY